MATKTKKPGSKPAKKNPKTEKKASPSSAWGKKETESKDAPSRARAAAPAKDEKKSEESEGSSLKSPVLRRVEAKINAVLASGADAPAPAASRPSHLLWNGAAKCGASVPLMDCVVSASVVTCGSCLKLAGRAEGALPTSSTAKASVDEPDEKTAPPSPQARGFKVDDLAPVVPLRVADLVSLKHRQRPQSAYERSQVESLAESIAAHGLVHPIGVMADGKTIIFGERRTEAYRFLGRDTIPGRIFEHVDDAIDAAIKGDEENQEREPVDAMTRAEFLSTLLRDEGLTQSELAKRLGVSAARVSQRLMVLDLPPGDKERLRRGEMTLSEAEAIVGEIRKERDRRAIEEKQRAAAPAPAREKPADDPKRETPEKDDAGPPAGAAMPPASKPSSSGTSAPASSPPTAPYEGYSPRGGAPKKRLDLKELSNPTLELSDEVEVVLQRTDTGGVDLEVTLKVAIDPTYRPETFDLMRLLKAVADQELVPHVKAVNVAIETGLRSMNRTPRPATRAAVARDEEE